MGRTRLLAALESLVGAGTGAVLTGPQGIGRSTLLDSLGTAALERGELVLSTAGTEAERGTPYAGLVGLLGRVPVERLAGLPAPQRNALYALLSGSGSSAGPAADRQPPVYRHALHRLLDRCAAERPVLLLVDDAQWLDGATVDVLRHALRRTAGPRVRAVTAGRWPTHPAAPADSPGPWKPAPSAAVLPVPPLAADETAELLARHGLPARIANTLHAESGGNPSLALALAEAFADRVPRHGRPAPLPQQVHTLIGERLGALPERTRRTLLTAALAARPTVDLLVRAGHAGAAQDVRIAATTGLVSPDRGTVRFTPPAVAAVLAESTEPGRCAAVHATLADTSPDAAERARHRALAAPGPDAALARSLAEQAAAATRRGAHRAAAELYLLAADTSPGEPAPADAPAHRTSSRRAGRRTALLVAAAESGAAAGMPALVHRAVDAVLGSDAPDAARVRARIALLDLSGQGLSEMDEVFAAARLEAGDDPALTAPLLLRRSWAALVRGEPERSAREAESAAALARSAGDGATEAMAWTGGAVAALVAGRHEHRDLLERAGKTAAAPPGLLHASPRFVAARFALFEDRLGEARQELLGMLALVDQGSGEETVHVLRALAEVSARTGRCRDALDYADRAVRLTEEASLSPGPAWWSAAVAELAGGSIARAAVYAERGLRASEEERDVLHGIRNLHVLGQARMRDGDLRGGVEALRRVRAGERERGLRAPQVVRWDGDLVAGLTALGETEHAAVVLREARGTEGSCAAGPGVAAQLDRAEALLRAACGDPAGALELLRDAELRFGELGQPLEVGHCLLERARVERRRRRHAAARGAVNRARTLFERCGARPWVEQSGRSLSVTGPGGALPSRRSGGGGGAESLTGNEARIASLVGEGATNREVATRMFLSVKTIEASLTRIYRKLGVRSRTQLGTRLRSGADAREAGGDAVSRGV
ncbi:AAA family ATPase [Streptomyces sp. TR06-5]|uniref:helix-turn-helix transcriptional regulator n=1 Tax=unclassified Streptomyces TaxID=2593676 RepID=UPI00399F460D